MTDATLKKMGDYEILGVLGAGGMGRVYKVRNTITDRIEAMKVLLPDLQGHDELAARFLREIKVLAALKHPNIASLLTACTIDNQLVMIMEYVEGETLASVIGTRRIALEEALSYIDQVLAALSYAHQQQIVHRDIKPANMMLTADGTVKLMDFGIARTKEGPDKLTQTGSTLGSINYMSPEQVKGGPIDARSDLYSVGISLYEMVTGQKPFQGDSNFSIMAAHLQQAPTPPVALHPGMPVALNELILKSIAKEPEQRFQSAADFRKAIQQVLLTTQEAKTIIAGSMAPTATGVSTPQFQPMAPPITSRTPVPLAGVAASRPTAAVTSPTSAATAPAAPVAVAQPVPTPVNTSRGIYMALGALVVLVGLIAAAVYLPGRGKSSASAQPASTQPVPAPVTTTAAPTQQPVPAPVTPAATADTSAQPTSAAAGQVAAATETSTPQSAAASAQPEPAPQGSAVIGGRRLTPRQQLALATRLNAQGANGANTNTAANTAELEEMEKAIDQLQTRVGAVNSSLDRLRREQAGSGFGIRGDMAERQEAMNMNFAKAQNALEHNELARAKRFAALAEANTEALEKFLGR